MFRKSDKNPQFDAFSSPAALLQGSSLNHYLKKDSWHNIFHEHVVMRGNEDIFKDLYCSDNDSPNASLCVLAGMMILKEGQRWSDEQLFEQCRYNLLVRSSLGLMNLTETCHSAESKDNSSKEGNEGNEGEPVLNLSTDINLDVVSTPDSDFLESSIEESQSILEDKIEKVYANGAYNSVDTQTYAQDNDMELILTGLQGKTPRYELSLNEENDDELIVLDTLTQQFLTAYLIATRKTNSDTENQEKKWRIVTDEGKYRYFTLENVRTSLLRQKLRDVPIEERWKRNNVEASIFQLGLHCTDGKTRYRGHAANRLWAYSRAMWINFRRIQKYVMQTGERSLLSEKGLIFFIKIWINIKNNVITLMNKFFNLLPTELSQFFALLKNLVFGWGSTININL
jgi:hypothetical protein